MTMTTHSANSRPLARASQKLMRISAVSALLIAALMLIAGPVLAGPQQSGSDSNDTISDDSVAGSTGVNEFRGETQQPFLCTTEYNGLGQPEVDNQDKIGTPVYPESETGEPDRTADPVGWSKNCQAEEVVEYRYVDTNGDVQVLNSEATELPADIAVVEAVDLIGVDEMEITNTQTESTGDADSADDISSSGDDATSIPFLYRFQKGTLPETRFMYSIAMLVPFESVGEESATDWDHRHWNQRLVYSFGGGVGIGHSQGGIHDGDSQLKEALRLGHAVVFSTGTRTSVHYNLLLGGRVANEVKDLFVTTHDSPMYTIGIGGSGGGIQQYVYNQNHPDLLDGLIPQYSYPDMTTQTINVGDCELLEHYMDVTDAENERWRNWDNRKLLQGQNTIEGFESDWAEATGATGSSECIEGWRGATPLALNPTFGFAAGMEDVVIPYAGELIAKAEANEPLVPEDFPDLGRLLRTSEDPDEWVSWTHWDDVLEVYGVDPDTSLPQIPWDNVGVQYGLRSVAQGEITPAEFLDLNYSIGSWKPMDENVAESCGMVTQLIGEQLGGFGSMIGLCEGDELDPYSARQMNLGGDDAPAPRRSADVQAITNAFSTGLVFDGELGRDLPILDVRHYLEHELDMHNVHQSFTVRERIAREMGTTDNHVVWFLDARPERDDDATDELLDRAYRVMDEWVVAHINSDGATAAEVKPDEAVDACWGTNGSEIAAGDDVWNGAVQLVTTGAGAWNDAAPTDVDGVDLGDCTAQFPLHSTSRIVAGGPITNDVYKCHLKPVEQAISDGDYGEWTPTDEEREQLELIFASGVCDWSKRSVGHPDVELTSTPRGETSAPQRVEPAPGISTEHSPRMVWVTIGTLLGSFALSGAYGWQLKRRSTRKFKG